MPAHHTHGRDEMGGVAYTMAKYNMSMCALGMAEEFRGRVSRVVFALRRLWPRAAAERDGYSLRRMPPPHHSLSSRA
jgi:hypothetical protein